MGEPVTVREIASTNPRFARFEINRSLTGMGHERYKSVDDIIRERPVDEVARRLFEAGGVAAVHVNSSVITVNLDGGSTGTGMAEIIENLFRFYGDDDNAADDAPADSEPAIEDAAGVSADPAVAEAPESVNDGPEADEAST